MSVPSHWQSVYRRLPGIFVISLVIAVLYGLITTYLGVLLGAVAVCSVTAYILYILELSQLNSEEGLRLVRKMEANRKAAVENQNGYSRALRAIYEQTDSELLQTYAQMMALWERNEPVPPSLLEKVNTLTEQHKQSAAAGKS